MALTTNPIYRALKRTLIASGLAGAALLGIAAPASAGQPCVAKQPTVMDMERGMALAQRTATRLDETGATVAMIARVGQDLRKYKQHYSHIGLVYKARSTAHQQPVWRVVHKLNHCGSGRAQLYRQGLAEFFSDDPFEWQTAIVPLKPEPARKVMSVLHNPTRLTAMHERRYSMLAYPWSTRYQQSNQWVMETLAMSLGPNIRVRDQAQAWLKLYGYQGDELRINAMTRLGARITKANIAFDDHPSHQRFSGRIRTTTADSSLRWLTQSGYGAQRITVYSTRRDSSAR